MEVKSILIIYGKNFDEVFNRKSAIGSYIHCLANLLSKKGHSIFLNGKSFSDVQQQTTANITPNHSIIKYIKGFIPKRIKKKIREKEIIRKNEENYATLLNTAEKVDAILEFYCIGSDLGLRLKKHFNSSYTIVYDNPIFEEYSFFNNGEPLYHKLFTERERSSLSQANQIVVYSNPVKEHLINKYLIQPDKFHIHQNIDFTRFELNANSSKLVSKIKIGFIGSFLKWHRVDILINGVKELNRKNIAFELYLVGEGQELDKMKELVDHETSIKEFINFTGYLDGEALRKLKSEINIGVMPGSNWYGAPNKLFEYGAAHIASIAPNTPTITDIFSENEIVFFEWDNQSSFNQALIDLCNKPEKIRHFGDALFSFIEKNYNAEKTANFYHELI